MEEHEDEIEFRYEYLEEMSDVEKEKFIEEYLFDDVLYSFDGDFDDLGMYGSTCSYLSLKEEKVEIEKWMTVVFRKNEIWAEWAEAMAKCLKLKEWVCLDLRNNQIWAEWAKVISKMKLKEWVILGLWFNKIWDGWAKAISQMELKEWVKIDLHWNKISRDMEEELRKWVESYKAKWINCKVEF